MNFGANGKEYVKRSVDECWSLLSTRPEHLRKHEECGVSMAFGRRLAADVLAPTNIPAIRASIVDGFAIRLSQSSIESSFRISGVHAAGSCPKAVSLEAGETVYVATGGQVPTNASCVIPIEQCLVESDTVRVRSLSQPLAGQNIREVGSDTPVGSLVLSAGSVIGAGEYSLLHACKVASVTVFSKVRVAVLSTGEEVVSGQIGDANRPYMLSRLREFSDVSNLVEIADLGSVSDDESEFARIVSSTTYDVLITTGSVGKGRTDFMKPVLESLRFSVLFGQVDLKPGKPTTAAVNSRNQLVLSLPGNPASCFVTFNLFALPAIFQLSGDSWSSPVCAPAAFFHPFSITPDSERPEFSRARATLSSSGRLLVDLVDGHQRSSRAASCSGEVNALVRIDPGPNSIDTRDKLFDCYILPGCSIPVSAVSGPSEEIVTTAAKARAFDSLVEWLKVRNDVENIALMDLAGFCRNCLSKWLSAGSIDLATARHYVYGMDYEEWKKLYRKGDKREHAPRIPVTASSSNPCASSLIVHSQPNLVGKAFVLTVSDRASSGVYSDDSGPLIASMLESTGMHVAASMIVPDDIEAIREAVQKWVRECGHSPGLIVTTGGTGFTQRDVTPEALSAIIEKPASGLSHLLLSAFVKKDPIFALTRLTAGAAGRTLIVSLPGRPSAVKDGMEVLLPVLPKVLSDLAQ